MAEGSEFLPRLSGLCNNRESNNARHHPMIRKGAKGDENDSRDLTDAATAVHDSQVLKGEEFGEFGRDCLGILPNTIRELKEKHTKGSSSVLPWIMSMIFAWIEIIEGHKGTSATVGDFEDVLDSNKYAATKERWLTYRDEAMDCCRTHCRELNKFIKNLFDFFKKLNHGDQKWMQFCMALEVDQKEFNIENLFRWIEKVGYLIATKDKLKEALKKIGLRTAIYPIENLYGSEPPLMCKLFSNYMEDNWTKIMEKLTSIQIKGIADVLACGNNEDEIFNEIVKHGNKGFHKFASALKDQISDLFNVYDEDVTILFQMTTVPKRYFFAESQGHTLMRDCFQQRMIQGFIRKSKIQGFIGPHMSDMVQYALELTERFWKNHALSVVYCLNGTDSDSLNFSIKSLLETLRKAGLSHPDTEHWGPVRAIEALAEVLKCSDFNVLLICYNCSKDVCEKRVWEKLVPSRLHDTDPPLFKVHILFLTKHDALKEFEWIHWQDWPVFEGEEMLKFLFEGSNATEEEKAKAKEVGQLCENSMFELGIVRAYIRGVGIDGALAVLQDRDNTKEHYISFKSDWVKGHGDGFLETSGFFCKVKEPVQQQSQVDCPRNILEKGEEVGAIVEVLLKKNQEYDKHFKELDKNIDELKKKGSEYKKEIENLVTKIEKLENENEKLQKVIEEKNRELKEKDKQLKEKDKQHQSAMSAKEEELNTERMKNKKLRLELKYIKKPNEEMMKLQSEQKKEKRELIKKEEENKQAINGLKTELEKMRKDLVQNQKLIQHLQSGKPDCDHVVKPMIT